MIKLVAGRYDRYELAIVSIPVVRGDRDRLCKVS